MPDIRDITERHGKYLDALITSFKHHLEEIVRVASARVTGILQRKLSITDGKIDDTPGNNRILRGLDKLFADQMDEAGYGRLVEAFVNQFPAQLPFLEEVIQFLHERLPDVPTRLQFTAQDLSALSSFQLSAIDGLESTVEGIGALAMRNAMFSLAGLKFADLVETLSEKFAVSVPRAVSMADTLTATFYRTANDRAFQIIESDLPQKKILYEYTTSPLDKKTRPFCTHMIQQTKAGKRWTREEIAELDNRQLPNVMLTAGGFGCRHQILMAVN